MSDPFFFGYGSLVNRRTHDYPRAAQARVRGWRRVWKKTKLRRLAFLSVIESPETEIDGLIAAVPGADWAALDLRERAYLRQKVEDIRHDHEPLADIQIYRTRPEHDSDASDEHPILLSYLDTVLQGYLHEFGRDGVAGFIMSTDGWDAPLLDDRADPIYPRFQSATAAERRFFDDQLEALGVRRLTRGSVSL